MSVGYVVSCLSINKYINVIDLKIGLNIYFSAIEAADYFITIRDVSPTLRLHCNINRTDIRENILLPVAFNKIEAINICIA